MADEFTDADGTELTYSNGSWAAEVVVVLGHDPAAGWFARVWDQIKCRVA